jgi:hypothetical protein
MLRHKAIKKGIKFFAKMPINIMKGGKGGI